MRFCATIRSPAPSNTALILPVRFRRVASGLMMESVRSVMCVLQGGGRGALGHAPPLGKRVVRSCHTAPKWQSDRTTHDVVRSCHTAPKWQGDVARARAIG